MNVKRRRIAQPMPAPETLTVRELLADLQPTLTPMQAQACLADSRAGLDQTVADPSIAVALIEPSSTC